MAILKLSQLEGACPVQRAIFRARYGKEVEVTLAAVLEAAELFDWDWAAAHLLSTPSWAGYRRVKDTASAEYERAAAPAWAEYERVRDTVLAEYERVIAPAWAEYRRVKDAAWAEYRHVKDAAWAEYERVRDEAMAEYQRVLAPAWFAGWEKDHA
jgi:cell division septum initiation protein DivIVA